MTEAQKKRIDEIDEKIKKLIEEKCEINPYAGLKSMSNKEFGENWSENWIRSKCNNLEKKNGSGHDMLTKSKELWEVKSSRLPCKEITFNQCHPYECNKFLFVLYDTIEGDETIYLVPAKDIKQKFSYSRQHGHGLSKEEADCISVSYNVKNRKLLETEYKVMGWEELNNLAK